MHLRSLILPVFAMIVIASVVSCNSGSSKPKTFCDTACLKDSIKFTGEHKLAPSVYISASSCIADTLTWTYKGMGVNRKVSLAEFLNNDEIHINKGFVRCIFNDTAYAWLIFNDCATGRGYQLKLPFNKTANIGRKGGGINNTDPKFSVADNLVAYSDRGNIFCRRCKDRADSSNDLWRRSRYRFRSHSRLYRFGQYHVLTYLG